jgi:hypothetical protein
MDLNRARRSAAFSGIRTVEFEPFGSPSRAPRRPWARSSA